MADCERCRKLLEAIEGVLPDVPPEDWDYAEGASGYDFLGWPPEAAEQLVSAPDSSNCGDMLAFGQAVGKWHLVWRIREAIARSTEE